MEDSHPGSAHWCHQCNAQMAAERAASGAYGDLICADCGGSFIEAMESAQALTHVRWAVRRRDRSQQTHSHTHSAALRRLEATISEADLNSPAFRQEVRNLMDLLPLHSRSSGLRNATSSDATDEAHDADVVSSDTAHTDHALVVHGMPLGAHGLVENELFSHVTANNDLDLGHDESARLSPVELSNATRGQEELGGNTEAHEDEDEEGSVYSQNHIDGDDEVSDSDIQVSVLELSDWDSFDEDDEYEWEEVDEMEIQVHDALNDLANFSREMELENLNLDTYVGNPGDYVDARGFEELLQQFMDSDNTRRGAPPAAKSAIEGLPTVLVQQEDVENGAALCAICKDAVELDKPAKQLPCLHLYHSECILPWLTVRNSCPVCRYELPTDDPDYEEQRKQENMWRIGRRQVGVNSDSSSASHEGGGEELGREGNLDGESIDTETNVLFSDTSKGEVGDDSETRGCPRVGNGYSPGSFLDVIAGPLFSVVGLVVVSCLGNLLLGSSSQRCPLNNRVGRGRAMRSGRSWWTNFFG